MAESFKLTYATMFNPPEELHTRFEQALAKVKANLGKEYGMIINGKDHFAATPQRGQTHVCELGDLPEQGFETLLEVPGKGVLQGCARKAQHAHCIERRRAGDRTFLLGQVEQPVVGLAEHATECCLQVRQGALAQCVEQLGIVLVHPSTLYREVLLAHGNSRGVRVSCLSPNYGI